MAGAGITSYAALLDRLHISEVDVAHFRDNNPGLCGVDLDRVSKLLIAQLSAVSKHRSFNSFSVTDVLQRLEGVGCRNSCIKDEEPFKHLPLQGLWKAHFFDARFLFRNLINHWGLEFEDSLKFNALWSQVSADEERDRSPFSWQGRLAHELTFGGFEARAERKKLTGEWIIFAKFNGLNYYLGIAAHSTSKERDEAIYALLKAYCTSDFPFLFGETK